MPEQTGEQDKMFGEADKPYVDPNSGAAPQPGGLVSPGAVIEQQAPKMAEPPIDPIFDAEMEHSAGPQGSQPGNPDGENANEAGTSESEEGEGSLVTEGDGTSGNPESTPNQEMEADGTYAGQGVGPGELAPETEDVEKEQEASDKDEIEGPRKKAGVKRNQSPFKK